MSTIPHHLCIPILSSRQTPLPHRPTSSPSILSATLQWSLLWDQPPSPQQNQARVVINPSSDLSHASRCLIPKPTHIPYYSSSPSSSLLRLLLPLPLNLFIYQSLIVLHPSRSIHLLYQEFDRFGLGRGMKAGDYEGGRAVPPMFQQHQMLHQHPNHHKFQTRVFQKRELHPSGSDETKAVNQVNRIGSEAFMVSPLATSDPKKQKRGTSGGGGDDGTGSGSSGDGGTVEVVRRPRGRPPGSKNRPKPPLVVQQDEDTTNGMRAHILEIPAGHDIGEALAGFSRRHGTGLSVISGTGLVSNVAFRQPALSATTTVTFHGRYELLSISATFFPPSLSVPFPPAGGLSISLAGPQGQVVGGLVAGQLISAGTVYLVAAAFKDPAFHRLPEEEMPVAWSLSGDNSRDGGLGEDVEEDVGHLQYNHHGGSGGAAEQSSVLPMFSCNLPSDLGWGPSPRALRPSPY